MPRLPMMAAEIATAATADRVPDFAFALEGEGHWGMRTSRRPSGDWVVVVDVDVTRERLTFEYKGRAGTSPGDMLKPVKRETING